VDIPVCTYIFRLCSFLSNVNCFNYFTLITVALLCRASFEIKELLALGTNAYVKYIVRDLIQGITVLINNNNTVRVHLTS